MGRSKSRRTYGQPFVRYRFDAGFGKRVHAMCREAAALGSPLALEQWVSMVLGDFWQHRSPAMLFGGLDPVAVIGARFVEACAELGGSEGKTALTALARIDRGPLGSRAGTAARALGEVAVPDWVERVGTAKIVGAHASGSPGDGEALLLETDQVGDCAHMLAVFIDERLGGVAKHLGLIRVMDPADEPGGSPFRPVDPVSACDRVRTAIDRTDRRHDVPLGENYANYRALAIARVTQA